MQRTSSKSQFRRFLEEVRKESKLRPGNSPHRAPVDASDRKADDPNRRLRRHRTIQRLLAEFWGQLRGFRGTIGATLAALTVATVIGLIPPYATKLAIDSVLGEEPFPGFLQALPISPYPTVQLWQIGAVTALVTFLGIGVGLWGRWHATLLTNKLTVALRKRAFDHAMRLPLHKISQIKSGGVASLLREDAGRVAELIFSMIYNPWRAVIQLVGSMIVLAIVDWRLLAGGVALLPIVYFSHRTWIARIRPVHRRIKAKREQVDGNATEAFAGMRVVRAFGRETSERNRFVTGNHVMIRQQLLAWWWSRLIELVWETVVPAASIALLIYGGTLVLHGELTLGELAMFLVYLGMLLGPLATLAASAASFQTQLAALDRVLDLLEEEQEFQGEAGGRALKPAEVAGEIVFRDVSFRYPGQDRFVLEDIDLRAEPGQMIALVGRSGAGKSTLCNLATRFHDPTTGTVELDGTSLKEIDLASFRRLLGVVEQDVFLFDGTIEDNIKYAARDATRQEVIGAAEAAFAHEFIRELEQGYDTVIGERGVRLSGGQRQRLAIARAILADPRILILDEATSNLDTESERAIQESMKMLMRGRTSFVIAHRLSTILHADRILVLDRGRIVEQGTHRELMARRGIYRQMIERQATTLSFDLDEAPGLGATDYDAEETAAK
jgi:ATP-binding cassette subfamily B protein/subfamily B ATP-binding cassette protein MsbA